MIRSGSLRTRATLQRRVESDNDSAGKGVRYETHGFVWCNDVSNKGAAGRQLREAQQIQTTLTHAVQLRYNSSIVPTMRLIIGEAVLNIVSVVDPDRRRREMIAQCSEVTHG